MMNPAKVTKICLWGGLATVLAGILLFGGGCMATITAPFYPYGEPRGAPVSWAGIVFLIIGTLMAICGASIKALGLGNRTRPKHETTDPE